jgi:hypothetical protein
MMLLYTFSTTKSIHPPMRGVIPVAKEEQKGGALYHQSRYTPHLENVIPRFGSSAKSTKQSDLG